MKTLILLSFLMILTSCASIHKNYSYADFLELKKLNMIKKVPSWQTCFKVKDERKTSIYYNFSGLDLNEVRYLSNYLTQNNFKMEQANYSIRNVKTNTNTYMVSSIQTGLSLVDVRYAVCEERAIGYKIHVQKGIPSKYHGLGEIISIEIIPKTMIHMFLKNKIFLNKIKQKMQNINEEYKNKFHVKKELYCVDDDCDWRDQFGYLSSYKINIVKEYTPSKNNGITFLINYGYILDALDYINKDKGGFLKELYFNNASSENRVNS